MAATARVMDLNGTRYLAGLSRIKPLHNLSTRDRLSAAQQPPVREAAHRGALRDRSDSLVRSAPLYATGIPPTPIGVDRSHPPLHFNGTKARELGTYRPGRSMPDLQANDTSHSLRRSNHVVANTPPPRIGPG